MAIQDQYGNVFLTEDEFDEGFDLVEVDGETNLEWEQVQAYPENRIWSTVDHDEGDGMSLLAGVRRVNRVGFKVTVQPWTDPTIEVLLYKVDDGGEFYFPSLEEYLGV